jgi:hypothetical protein
MRIYEKPNPEKTVSEPKSLKTNIVSSEQSAFLKDAGANYRKEERHFAN